jgi:1-acyl-sn-glycerol-3-phosphate acyltransferase
MPDRFDAAFFPLRALLAPAFTLAFRGSVEGRQHFPQTGAAILAANHASFLDPILIGMRARRPVRFVVSQEFYADPRLNAILRWFGAIPVGGDAGTIRAFRRIADVIRRGELLGIFPEGGITRDGAMRPFRAGAAVIALRAGVPVVPIHVGGTFEAWPRVARWPRLAPVSLRVGPPIDVPAQRNPSEAEIAMLTERIRTAVSGLGTGTGTRPR